MNVWTDIALGNLQRRRGPPLDIDPDTDQVREITTQVCIKCGTTRMETEFYLGTKPDGTKYRRSTCKACCAEVQRTARAKKAKPRPIPQREVVLYVITKEPMSMAEIARTMGISRRTVDKCMKELIAQGRAFFYENTSNKYNPRIPTYWIQPKHKQEK